MTLSLAGVKNWASQPKQNPSLGIPQRRQALTQIQHELILQWTIALKRLRIYVPSEIEECQRHPASKTLWMISEVLKTQAKAQPSAPGF